MNRFLRWGAALLAAAFLCGGTVGCGAAAKPPFTDPDKLHIVASFYVMADFAGKVGGDNIEVYCLASGGDPHDWEPAPRDISALEQADVLVLNGGGFEHWADAVLPTLQNENLQILVTGKEAWLNSQAHDHADEEGHDHEGEDVHDHSSGDPHFWLDPQKAAEQVKAIAETLAAADPANEKLYHLRAAQMQANLEQLDTDFSTGLAGISQREIVVSHAAFGHLCTRYDLTQIAVQGLAPEGEPDPAQMAKVIDVVSEHKIHTIFFEQQASPKVADAIARETGVNTAVLETLESLSAERVADGEDYLSVMHQNLVQLQVALR